jgi:hypothetical protein
MVHCDVIGQFYPSQTRLLALQLQPEDQEGGVILARGSTLVLYWGGGEQDSFVLRQNYFAVGNKTTCKQRRSRLRLATTDMSLSLANSNPHPQKETLQDDGSPLPFLPRPKTLLSKEEYKPMRRVSCGL